MNDYNERVINCVALFAIDDKISPDDALVDLGIDSLKIVELLLALEDEFDIEFDASSLNPTDLTTAGSLLDIVQQHFDGGKYQS